MGKNIRIALLLLSLGVLGACAHHGRHGGGSCGMKAEGKSCCKAEAMKCKDGSACKDEASCKDGKCKLEEAAKPSK